MRWQVYKQENFWQLKKRKIKSEQWANEKLNRQCIADDEDRQRWNILAKLSEDSGLELSGLKCICKGGIRILCARWYYAFPTQAIPSSVSQEDL